MAFRKYTRTQEELEAAIEASVQRLRQFVSNERAMYTLDDQYVWAHAAIDELLRCDENIVRQIHDDFLKRIDEKQCSR